MGEYRAVAKLTELTPNRGHFVDAGSHKLALFLVDGVVYALDNTCPHRGGDLAEGDVENGLIYCPLHAWAFSLKTGKQPIGASAVRTYAVRVVEGAVEVELD